MIRINLLAEKKTIAASEPYVIHLIVLVAGFIVVGVLCYLLGVSLDVRLKRLNEEIAKKNDQFAELELVVKKVEELKVEKAGVKSKLESVKEILGDRTKSVRLMEQVAKIIPAEVWITKMSLSGTSIAIEGAALDPVDISNFYKLLKKSAVFSEVKLDDVKFSKELAKGKAQYKMNLTVGAV
jgi:type IV pilus assembly protein PilN